jgi:hypothetical protein
MVAGDHHGLDARSLTGRDRRARLGARRIHHRHEPSSVISDSASASDARLPRDGEHAQPSAAMRALGLADALAVALGQRHVRLPRPAASCSSRAPPRPRPSSRRRARRPSSAASSCAAAPEVNAISPMRGSCGDRDRPAEARLHGRHHQRPFGRIASTVHRRPLVTSRASDAECCRANSCSHSLGRLDGPALPAHVAAGS